MDKFKRYQKTLNLADLYPSKGNLCSCGCGKTLIGRKKRWFSIKCSDKAYINFAILKGSTGIIRKVLYSIDFGYCRKCGVYDEHWEADHIKPVFQGGGYCTIDNFQTLCKECHKEKTRHQMESHRE